MQSLTSFSFAAIKSHSLGLEGGILIVLESLKPDGVRYSEIWAWSKLCKSSKFLSLMNFQVFLVFA